MTDLKVENNELIEHCGQTLINKYTNNNTYVKVIDALN